MIVYYLIFLAGLLPGFVFQFLRKGQVAYWIMLGCGYTMVVFFGMQMGSAREIRHALPGDLAAATLIALFSAIGSIGFAFLFTRLVLGLAGSHKTAFPPSPSAAPPSPVSRFHAWRSSIAALGLLGIGILCGSRLPALRVDSFLRILLLTMIASVGVQSGQGLHSYLLHRAPHSNVRHASRIIFFGLPIFIIAGTLVFSAGTALLLKYSWSECMLCAAPMGWQTLGGPMVQDLRGPRLGNVAFLTNMFRDIVSLLLIPLVSRGRFALLGVAPGGVSTMDILLPGIMATAGPQYLMQAMWVGACCSFWAPILIGLIARVLP